MSDDQVQALETNADDVLSVRECSSCGGVHENLPVQQYKVDRPPYTHWYTCPTTGDPVSLSLVVSGDNTPTEVHSRVLGMIVKAQEAGQWMAAIFRVADSKVVLERTTINFPTGDFRSCVALLQQDLDNEFGPPKQAQPLPAAGEIKPVVNMFEGKATPPAPLDSN